jgi:TolA-binding protein
MTTVIGRVIVICGIAAIAMSATGCSHMPLLFSTTKQLGNVQDTLKMELAAVQAKILEEQSKLMEEQAKLLAEQKAALEELRINNEMLRLMRADQSVNFSQLNSRVTAIERNLYENQTRLSALDQRTSEVNRQLQRRMVAEEDAETLRRQQIEKLLEIAMGDFNAGRYDLAINGFLDLTRLFPDTPQAAEAEYWIAESNFAKKDYAAAERLYFEFIKKYPNGPRACVSFYKLGLAYERQKKMQSRDVTWANLLERCPDSQEAQAVMTLMEQ